MTQTSSIECFQGKSHPSVDFLIFGSMTLIAAFLSMRLPETAHIPMPETIEDLDSGSGQSSLVDPQASIITEDKLKLLEGEINADYEEDDEIDTSKVEP